MNIAREFKPLIIGYQYRFSFLYSTGICKFGTILFEHILFNRRFIKRAAQACHTTLLLIDDYIILLETYLHLTCHTTFDSCAGLFRRVIKCQLHVMLEK